MAATSSTPADLIKFYNECHVSWEVQQTLFEQHRIIDYDTLHSLHEKFQNSELSDIPPKYQAILAGILSYVAKKKASDSEYDPLVSFSKKKYVEDMMRMTKNLRLNGADNDGDGEDSVNTRSSEGDDSDDDDSYYEPRLEKMIIIRKKPTKPVLEDNEEDYEEDGDIEEYFDDGFREPPSANPFMTAQGIEANPYHDGLTLGDNQSANRSKDEEVQSVIYKGRKFHVGKTYFYNHKEGSTAGKDEEEAEHEDEDEMESEEEEKKDDEMDEDVNENKKKSNFVVGITSFTPNGKAANYVEIRHISETFLGYHDKEDGWLAEALPDHKFVQVVQPEEDQAFPKEPFQLKFFGKAVGEDDDNFPSTIPQLVYAPQKEGNRRNFAYYYDYKQYGDHGKDSEDAPMEDDGGAGSESASKPKAASISNLGCYNYARPREGKPRVLDLFSGSGGMHLGYKREGFETAAAVELNEKAVKTFRHNNKGCKGVIYNGDVNDFFEDYKNNVDGMQEMVGRVDVVHASSPCQGFSGANVFGGKNDKRNNDLSLTFVEALKITQAPVGVFENVSGMWKTQHLKYIRTILTRLLEMDYQFRCTLLWACNYGDSQKRPRLFIFAVKKYAPMVPRPAQTHGRCSSTRYLLPYVPVKAVLEPLLRPGAKEKYPNMDMCRTTSLKAGEQKLDQLDPNGLAPTVKASGVLLHYGDGERCVNVREAAAIMSVPYDYEYLGTMTEQYKQVGNGVPVELASAVARTIKPVLRWVYEEEEEHKKLAVGAATGNGDNGATEEGDSANP